MTKIWKYSLPITGEKILIEVPMVYADIEGYTVYTVESQIRYVGVQYGKPTLWIAVNPDAPKQTVEIQMFGTGDDCYGTYLGTVLLMDDSLVLHVFLTN